MEICQGPVTHPTTTRLWSSGTTSAHEVDVSTVQSVLTIKVDGNCVLFWFFLDTVSITMCARTYLCVRPCVCVCDGSQAASWRSQHIRLSYRCCECGVHFFRGKGNRSDRNISPAAAARVRRMWKNRQKEKIAAIHNAKGSSAGCVQISFGKSQHAHNELYCVFLIGISAPRRGHDEPPRVSYCRKSERD